ncbi:MAG: hypothetical protein KGJ82_03625 [Nitrospirota bacterium]|nr:hypothetical protein [Nitrospirota bacterium]
MFTNDDLDRLIQRADAFLARQMSSEEIEVAVDAAFRERYGHSFRGDDVPAAPAAKVKSNASTNGDATGQARSLAQLKKDFPSLFGEDADDADCPSL